jgi:hypothetical protein
MSFETLKRNSTTIFDKLNKEIDKLSTSESSSDNRFWKPEVDKSGNGYAVIRFLPAKREENIPWVKLYSHAFQGPGGWYIENCLSTMNQSDPVMELNRSLWNTGSEKDKDIARKQKRKLSFYSNIYVVKDPNHPENEGKVFLYKYGKKIHDKIIEAIKPEFEDESPVNIFDFWSGSDFKLKIRNVDGYWNYDKSEFSPPSVLGNFSDDELQLIYNNSYDLQEFVSDNNFKSYEELQKRLNTVLNSKPAMPVDRETYEDEENTMESSSNITSKESFSLSNSSPDDTLSYFARLAEED